ncbi:MAG: Asp-tRNA(Asn)/Glu-tRNA(Gln) amidotransferase GatCAB subunit A, partial [Chloroflexi bacterium]
METAYLSLADARGLLDSRQISAVELTESMLGRIDEVDGALHAYLLVSPDFALDQARRADEIIARDEAGPLTGIPIGLKDILSVEGMRTTCGSRILETYVPRYDATVVRRLREGGAVILGKTNMD